ncbi:MAG TPA: hypothetical protein PL054_07700, partial [Clostridia bacterium]|nr:hypothetical protein [Clostridia bacterium]
VIYKKEEYEQSLTVSYKGLMQNQNKITWTIPLVKSIRYTSYQFYAISEPAKGISIEHLFIKEILHILQWIKKKCTASDNPLDENLPDVLHGIPQPDEFASYALDNLKSFRYDTGYQLEVIVTKDRKNWAMNILEPDRGPTPYNPKDGRKPVAGRLFETDIGLRRNAMNVEIATRTYVHEPVGIKEECDAFRQGFITELIRDSNIKLRNEGWPVKEDYYMIENKNSYENLLRWLKSEERQSLAIIYSETLPVKKEKKKDEPEEPEKDFESLKIKFNELAKKYRAYAFFFYIPSNRRNKFLEDMASSGFEVLGQEDLILIDAKKFNDAEMLKYDYLKSMQDDVISAFISKKISKYFEKKEMNFNKMRFIPDLRDVLAKETEDSIKSEKDILKDRNKWKEDYHSLKRNYEADIAYEKSEKDRLLNNKNEEVKKLKDELKEYKDNCESCIKQHINELDEKEIVIKRLRNLQSRPKKFKDIPKWVEENFTDKLILCKRAQDEIMDIKSEYDIDNICDAIEYLALDHYEQMNGNITEQEKIHKASLIYDNHFKIMKQSVPKITNTTDYEFTYNKKSGKLINALIDMHLYLEGKEPRIYYTYDKEDKRIIIASLPRHLKY